MNPMSYYSARIFADQNMNSFVYNLVCMAALAVLGGGKA